MRPATVVLLYWWRLRAQPLQELLAGLGIAAGVALLFAVQVANTSIGGSVEQLVRGITGQSRCRCPPTTRAASARRCTAQVRAIDGVRSPRPCWSSAPGSAGRPASGTSTSSASRTRSPTLGGPLVSGFGGRFGPRLADALLLPEPLASERVGRAGEVRHALDTPARQSARPGLRDPRPDQIGTAIESPLVVAPLAYVQRLSGLPDRVTRVLVAVRPGSEARVRERAAGACRHAACGRAERRRRRLRRAGRRAERPVHGAVRGDLRDRRDPVHVQRDAADRARAAPARRRAATAGLQAPPGLLRSRSRRPCSVSSRRSSDCCSATCSPATSSTRRPATSPSRSPSAAQRMVDACNVALALAGGIGATFVATAPLLRDLFTRGPVDGVNRGEEEPGEAIGTRTRTNLAVCGAALLAERHCSRCSCRSRRWSRRAARRRDAGARSRRSSGTLRLLDDAQRRHPGSSLPVAVMELRSSLTRAIGTRRDRRARAVRHVAIEGAHRDLLHGWTSPPPRCWARPTCGSPQRATRTS